MAVNVLLLLLGLGAAGAQPSQEPGVEKVIFTQELAKIAGARCLDSSPAGYFIKAQDPKRWVVYLQGGGLCIEALDCQVRSRGPLGSSTKWGDTWPEGDSIFQRQPEAFFHNWSQVFVPYCSGDMWLGTARERRILPGGLQMSGHHILGTVLEHLASTTAFDTASEVVFAGSSAGGVGVLQHADWFHEQMRTLAKGKLPRMTVMPLAGVFFPQKYPVLFPDFAIGKRSVLDNFMARYCHMIEGGFLHQGCIEALNGTGRSISTCFDVSNVLPHVQASLFLVQNQFDRLQIHDLGLCPPTSCSNGTPPNTTGGRFISYFGTQMNATLKATAKQRSDVGIFATSWFDHDKSLKYEIAGRGVGIGGTSFTAAFTRWYVQHEPVHLFAAACDGASPCGACPEPDGELGVEVTTMLI